MNTDVRKLKSGDLIRTNPQEGFWGCAVVLDRFNLSGPFCSEVCHIAVTDVVRRTKFDIEEVHAEELRVHEFEQHYNPTKDSLYVKTVICITKYVLAGKHSVELMGSIEPRNIYTGPLSENIGSNPGEFPLQNSIDGYLGNEAIISWRRKYDSAAWEALVAKSNAEYFDREEERLRKNRKARKLRKNS